MEQINSMVGRSGAGSPLQLNDEKKKNGAGWLLLKQILLANFSLSVYVNNWKEELYIPFAARITCFEIFTILLTLQYLFYPKLRNQQDVIYFCSLATFVFYISFFYIRNHIVFLFKNLKIKRLHQQNANDLPSRTTAFFLLANSILISFAFTVKEIYEYHTRFFWWNH